MIRLLAASTLTLATMAAVPAAPAAASLRATASTLSFTHVVAGKRTGGAAATTVKNTGRTTATFRLVSSLRYANGRKVILGTGQRYRLAAGATTTESVYPRTPSNAPFGPARVETCVNTSCKVAPTEVTVLPIGYDFTFRVELTESSSSGSYNRVFSGSGRYRFFQTVSDSRTRWVQETGTATGTVSGSTTTGCTYSGTANLPFTASNLNSGELFVTDHAKSDRKAAPFSFTGRVLGGNYPFGSPAQGWITSCPNREPKPIADTSYQLNTGTTEAPELRSAIGVLTGSSSESKPGFTKSVTWKLAPTRK